MIEQENDQLNISQATMRSATPVNPASLENPPGYPNRIRHVYLEQQNIYGRFVPFLLLKDKLHSQIDSSGSSALIHMCSHNSPYIPLYLSTLKEGDPILNRPTNQGHTPLDVAAMYCRRQYVELLKAKGAIDDGRVDSWAIQGGNIANWSGNVDPQKKVLIHWAAYNNLPQVMAKFVQARANVNQPDQNGNTPIDMAVMSKSYETVQILARLGYRPKEAILKQAQSPYFFKLFDQLNRSQQSLAKQKFLKLLFIPAFLLSSALLSSSNPFLAILALGIYTLLATGKPVADSLERPTKFYSALVAKEINYRSNHLSYVLLMVSLVVCGLDTLLSLDANSYLLALYFWMIVVITLTFSINSIILFYGICTNTTSCEMFQSHKHAHLWKKIDYIPARNIVVRVYKNLHNKGTQNNIQEYLNNRGQ